jgi:hypothetical protein
MFATHVHRRKIAQYVFQARDSCICVHKDLSFFFNQILNLKQQNPPGQTETFAEQAPRLASCCHDFTRI